MSEASVAGRGRASRSIDRIARTRPALSGLWSTVRARFRPGSWRMRWRYRANPRFAFLDLVVAAVGATTALAVALVATLGGTPRHASVAPVAASAPSVRLARPVAPPVAIGAKALARRYGVLGAQVTLRSNAAPPAPVATGVAAASLAADVPRAVGLVARRLKQTPVSRVLVVAPAAPTTQIELVAAHAQPAAAARRHPSRAPSLAARQARLTRSARKEKR